MQPAGKLAIGGRGRVVADLRGGVGRKQAARELVQTALARSSNDNVSAVVAWMMPAGATLEPQPVEVEAGGRGALLVPVLVLIGLLVFIAIVAVILFMGGGA